MYPRLEAEAELYTDDVVICQPPPGELQEDVFFGFESFVVAIFGGVYSYDQINKPFGTNISKATYMSLNRRLQARVKAFASICRSLQTVQDVAYEESVPTNYIQQAFGRREDLPLFGVRGLGLELFTSQVEDL